MIVIAQIPKKPFPQHVTYFKGVIKPDNVSQKEMDDNVCSFYNQWKQQYVKKDECGHGLYIWTENATGNKICVSEGQGYGMLITALMAGYDKTAKETYDGLFNYYISHPSKRSNYLMSWAQTKNCNHVENSSATDGDMDIAYSLLLADAQWNSNGIINYLAAAKNIINAIFEQEINHTAYSILLSNSTEHDSKDYFDTRSSDFMPAHFRVFQQKINNLNWNKVIDNNYKLFNYMQEKYSKDAGLIPDFIQHINLNAQPASSNYLESKFDGSYNYNACRNPWRIATDYISNGEIKSKQIIDKINTWIKKTTNNNPDNISAGYSLAGDDLKGRNFEALSFITPFAIAAMVDAKNQIWLNKLWTYIVNFKLNEFDYYDNTIKMINLIILSGNYWKP